MRSRASFPLALLGMPLRFWGLSALAVGAAVLIMLVMFSDDRSRAQQACVARGGEVAIVSDAQSIGQYCLLPNGERVPL